MKRFISLILCTFVLAGCSDSSTQKSESVSEEDGLPKLETLNISTDLEKSQYGDIGTIDASDKPVAIDEYRYIYDAVRNELKESVYHMDNPVISFDVINDTDGEISFGDYFQLEILLESEWYTIPPVNYFFTDSAYILPEHEKYNDIIDISKIDVNYIPGKYRLIKEYGVEKLNGDESGNVLCINEFEIVE